MIPNILSWIIFLPVIGAVAVLCVPKNERRDEIVKWISAAFTGLQLILAIMIFMKFDRTTASMQFEEKASWIASYNIWY